MVGGSDDHSRLCINLLTMLNLHLRGGGCQFFAGDVKVNDADQFFYYPDAFVTCDPRDRGDRYVKRHPKLIVEVLSTSTQIFDSGEKFQDYQQLASLEEYVSIAQDSQRVECHRRISATLWETTVYTAGDRVCLNSIDLEFAIAALYRGLDN